MKDIIYFAIFLLIAAGIGYGFDVVFSSLIPRSQAGFFIDPFSFGIRPIGISLNVCGIIGLICAYGIMKFIKR